MHTERLTEFARLLRNIKTELPQLDAFDINFWYKTDDDDLREDSETILPLKEGFCKTSACALGSAALHKSFNDQGLYLDGHKIRVRDVFGNARKSADGCVLDSESAGAAFFDLTEEQADWLFWPSFYEANQVTPEMVARRVDAILAGTDDTEDYYFGID